MLYFETFLSLHQLFELIKSPFILRGELSYIIFHKKTEKKIIGKIEAGLQKIKHSGEYEEIRDMY